MKAIGLGLLLGLALAPAGAQGCSQCRETVGQTPPKVQAAYRHGIEVLMVAGFVVFGSGVVAIRWYGK